MNRRRRGGFWTSYRGSRRQPDAEPRAACCQILCKNHATVFHRDVLRNRKAQSGAAGPRREKRLEKFGGCLAAKATSGVGHAEKNPRDPFLLGEGQCDMHLP